MEKHDEQYKSIKDTILSKIDSKEISMRTKKYFVGKTVALIALVSAVLIVSAGLFNFIFFSIRIHSHGYLLSFGPQGFSLFLMLFPWWMLVLDAALIVILEWLIRKFRFGYKVPVLYLLLVLLGVAALLGFTTDRITPVNDRLLHRADSHQLPRTINGFYEGFRRPPRPEHGVCNCVITAIDGQILSAYEKNDPSRLFTIFVPENDQTMQTLSLGDTIFAAGNLHDGVLYTFGIRKTTDETAPFE